MNPVDNVTDSDIHVQTVCDHDSHSENASDLISVFNQRM